MVDNQVYRYFIFFMMIKKRGDYFLRTPAASTAVPIAARSVATPTGDFCVTPAAAGAAGIAALATGTCAGAFVADAVPATWWIQWYCTIASALCPQMVLLHSSYPFTPHRCVATLSDMHSHGAVQTGASTPEVSWVSATIPIDATAAPGALHNTVTIPRIKTILI